MTHPSNSTAYFVANGLSASRVVLSPVFLWLSLEPSVTPQRLAMALLTVLFVTDIVDGWIARRWGVTSKFGYLLDGLGDRATYMACWFVIAELCKLGYVVIYLLIFRDVSLYCLRSFVADWAAASEETRLLTKAYAISLKVGLGLGLAPHYIGLVGGPQSLGLNKLVSIYFTVFLVFSYGSLVLLTRAYAHRV